MVAAAAPFQAGKIAPFDPFRHLGPVAELIGLTFAGELGPRARHTLRRMQRAARWGGLGLWLWGTETALLGAPGFVWLEEGRRVMGNVSLRRAASPGGWIIGNVAVHPNWQGHGIGRALVDTAVEMAAARGGSWIGLEVQETNTVARHLYGRMGFEPVGTMLELIRPAGLSWPRIEPVTLPLRRARSADSGTLYRLAQEGLSRPHREVLEVRPSLYRAGWEARLDGWLAGYREDWWAVAEEERVVGALRLNSLWPGRWHRLEVLVCQERLDDLGPRLAATGLAALSHRRPWEATTALPGPREALEPAFVAAGFRRLRHLIQMRLILRQRVRVVG
jgi:GNAT superfamily N-acetyltransferase